MRILFQGDSITDAGRARDNFYSMGYGYPMLVQGALGYACPNEYEFLNRGISGDRSIDIYARIKKDIINLKPDVMSILMGVNDVLHELEESPNGVDNNKFYRIYSFLIEEVKANLPDVKIMILGPYVLKGALTEANWNYLSAEVAKRAELSNCIAEENGTLFIPLQEKFNEALARADASYWLVDGVHPTAMGHELIKKEWIKAFDLLVK